MTQNIISLPPWLGLIDTINGLDRTFMQLAADGLATQLDLRVNTPDVGELVVTISDGTSDLVATIPALAEWHTHTGSVPFLAGPITVKVEGATSPSMGLTGSLYVTADSAMPGGSGAGLVTLGELLAALGISDNTPTDDLWLERQISWYSDRVRQVCDRWFLKRRYLATWYKPHAIYLTDAPVDTILSCVTGSDTIAVGDLRVDVASGQVAPPRERGPDWRGTDLVTMEFDAGWDLTPPYVAELLYIGIGKRWALYRGGDLAPESPATLKGETIAGAGGVQYAVAPAQASGAGVADFMLGFPLSALYPYKRLVGDLGRPDDATFWDIVVVP